MKSDVLKAYVQVPKWAISEKNSNRDGGRLRMCNFQEYQRNNMWDFQGLIKSEVEFARMTKKK